MSDFFTTMWEFIKQYWYIVLSTIIIILLVRRLFVELWETHRLRRHQRWLWRQEEKKKKKEQKQLEKEKNKYRTYSANNWLYNDIIKYRTIVFKGLPGAGKTSGALNFARFLIDKILSNEAKNRRYYEVMSPEFVKQRDKLLIQNKVPLYTNITNVHDTYGRFALENAEDIVFQRKKANTPCVVVLDESSDILGKDSYVSVQHEKDLEKRADNDGAKQTAKKLRHIGMWLFLTDQGGDDVVYTVRGVGFQTIKYIQTVHELSDKGKRVQKSKLWCNKWLPGWIVRKCKLRFAESLFFGDKIKTFFKLFLPGKYFEKDYYTERDKIYQQCNLKYTIWKQLFEYKGKCYWVYYNNNQTFLYNHKEFRSEYDQKFDDSGNRKKVVSWWQNKNVRNVKNKT